MNRRKLFPLLAVFAGAAGVAAAQQTNPMMDLLTMSAREKKGVTVYCNGGKVEMLVTHLGLEFVEGRSQAYSRIVVRITAIDAVTMS